VLKLEQFHTQDKEASTVTQNKNLYTDTGNCRDWSAELSPQQVAWQRK
jgi:hypothetical protein